MSNAIIMPYNPYERYNSRGFMGRVVPHIFHAERNGAVF